MSKDFSRRAFLGLGATAAAGAAALGVAGCSPAKSSGSGSGAAASKSASGGGAKIGMQTLNDGIEREFVDPPKGTIAFESGAIDKSKIKAEEEYDLVVCGAGMAGMAAAYAGTEMGLKVCVIEKTAKFNTRGHDICSISSKLIKEAGIEFDEEKFLNAGVMGTNFRCDIDMWKTWIANNGEAIDWFIDTLGSDITAFYNAVPDGAISTFAGVDTWHTQIQFKEGLEGFLGAEEKHATAKGAKFMYETAACQLVQTDGKITGVIAKNADGYIKLNATKGVVLATGGYENNMDMMKETMRPEDLCVVAWRLPNTENTGDGHMMGMAVGGVMDAYPHIMMRDPGGSVVAKASAKALTLPLTRVNKAGHRFVNESIAPNYLSNALMRQPGGHDFVILAGETLAKAIEATSYRTYSMSAAKLSPEELEATLKDIVVTAPTLDELASKTGIDAANLKATCARVTELHAKGEDEDWGADAGMMSDFTSGPYYAIEEGGANLVTVSGLQVSPKSEVLNKDGLPIPGLFALGNCSGSMFSDSYPHEISGISHGRCVVFAYLLAKHLSGK